MNEKDKMKNKSKHSTHVLKVKNKSNRNCTKFKGTFRKPSPKRGKGGKIMFPTDNEARKVANQSREVDERIRHNKRNEELTERGQVMDAVSKLGSATVGSIPKILGNHPAWYLNDPSLANQTTQISVQIPIGINQPFVESKDYTGGDKTSILLAYGYIPLLVAYSGIITDDPSAATANVEAAPCNYVSKALYAYIKNKARRNLQYAPGDIIRTLIAVVDSFCDLEIIKRVYRIANTYRFLNRTLASKLIEATGFSFEQTENNLSEILFRVNRLGKMLQTIHIPRGQTIYERWMFLASHVFKDIDSDKSRLFVFRKMLSYRLEFGEKISSNWPLSLRAIAPHGTDPSTVVHPENAINPLDYIKAIENRVTALLSNSEILGAMADMLTAFEDKGFYVFEPLESASEQEFTYDPVMIRQVRNATITGIPIRSWDDSTNTLDPQQFNVFDIGNGNLVQGWANESTYKLCPPKFPCAVRTIDTEIRHYLEGVTQKGSIMPRIGVDTFTDNPDAGELLTVTRFSAAMALDAEPILNNTSLFVSQKLVSHGTEILTHIRAFCLTTKSPSQDILPGMVTTNTLKPLNSNDSMLRTYLRSMCYNALPRMICGNYTVTAQITGDNIVNYFVSWDTDYIYLGDIDHVIYIDNDMIARWHFIAIASELALSDVVE